MPAPLPEAERPPRVQPPLSPTERTVLQHLMQGMTEREVAQALNRSHNTVHVHVRNIYRKIGVSTRKALFQVMLNEPSIFRAGKRA